MSKGVASPNESIDFSISWMPIWDCNLSCEYCGEINIYRGHMPGPEGGSLNGEFREKMAPVHWSEWVRAFNELPGRALIDISGGEPFMYKDLINVITNIDERHLLALTTNLTFPISRFIENISPERMISVTGSLHLNNRNWRTTFFKRLPALYKAGFRTQCNFVAYPKQLHVLPELYELFNKRPTQKTWVRGEVLRPPLKWIKGVNTGRDGEPRYYYYCDFLSKQVKTSRWNEMPSGYNGIVYKNGEPLPFDPIPEFSHFPSAKIHGRAVFINATAFDPEATYSVDYGLGDDDLEGWDKYLRDKGYTQEMIDFVNESRGHVTLTIEPYSGGAPVPFEGYSEEERELIAQYSDSSFAAKKRKEIGEVELAAGIEKPPVKLCNAGQYRFMIAPNGNVYPCNMIYMKRRELCMGNFLEIYRTLDERILCDLPCTCGGDREHVIIEYQE